MSRMGQGWLLLSLLPLLLHQVSAGDSEKLLIKNLLTNYNHLERPVASENDTVPLEFGIFLQQIIDLDEKNQILTSNVWLDLTWKDAYMMWNISDYNNITDIRITPNHLWRPDLLLYNSANEDFESTYPSHLIVRHDGSVSWIPPGLFKSTCKVDITWFPFDQQNCTLKFGTWTYHEALVNLTLKGNTTKADISGYQENAEWQLVSATATRNNVEYQCCPEVYLDITFAFIIQRRTIYYFNNLIIPCIIIASMVIFGFHTPPDSGEKLTLCITILMSLTFFMNMVSSMMPPTSKTPLIGTYFSCIMVMVACSVVCTILILNYHKRTVETHEMPEWVETIFLKWLPWLLRMDQPGIQHTLKSLMMDHTLKNLEKEKKKEKRVKLPSNLMPDILHHEDDFIAGNIANANFPLHKQRVEETLSPGGSNSSLPQLVTVGQREKKEKEPYNVLLESNLQKIYKEILVISSKIKQDQKDNDVAAKWKRAAMVMDRLCLVVFVLFTTILSLAVFISAPKVIVY